MRRKTKQKMNFDSLVSSCEATIKNTYSRILESLSKFPKRRDTTQVLIALFSTTRF